MRWDIITRCRPRGGVLATLSALHTAVAGWMGKAAFGLGADAGRAGFPFRYSTDCFASTLVPIQQVFYWSNQNPSACLLNATPAMSLGLEEYKLRSKGFLQSVQMKAWGRGALMPEGRASRFKMGLIQGGRSVEKSMKKVLIATHLKVGIVTPQG